MELDISDLRRPEFRVDEVDIAETIIIELTIRATCDIIRPENQPINAIFKYDTPNSPTGIITCAEYRPLFDIKPALKFPDIRPISATSNSLVFPDFTTPTCATITVVQTGEDAFVDDFNLLISDIDLINSINLVSANVNGQFFDINDPSLYNYDASMMQAVLNIGGDFFIDNFHPLDFPIPIDNRFDENERLTVELCFVADDCMALPMNNLTIGTTFSCPEELCPFVSEMELPLDFEPLSRAEPEVSATNIQSGSLCGDPFIVDLMIRSDMNLPNDGAFLDLRVLLDLCAAEQMLLTNAAIATSDGTYIDLPFGEDAVVEFDTLDSDGTLRADIHFDNIASDLDGMNFGLEDIDGDGDFGDLQGDQELIVRLEYQVLCSSTASRGTSTSCSPLACMLDNIIVEGVRNCTQDFQQSTPIIPAVSYFYGADTSYTNEVNGEIIIGAGSIQSDDSV